MDPFSAPIPGQSLTTPPGSAPYEKPVQYTDPNKALEYLFAKMSDPRQATRLSVQLQKGIPVEFIARTVLFQGFMDGLWTVDVAMLIGPTVVRLIAAVGKNLGISNMVIKNPDVDQQKYLSGFVDLLDSESKKRKPNTFKGFNL